MVAVEAHHGRQLTEHLQDLGRDDQQQGVVAQPPPEGRDADRDYRVEVEPAEVGAHPPGPAEAVGVGDVGVEGGPHEVEPDAHHSGCGPAVPRCRRVPELVEARGQDGHGEDQDQQPGTLERVVGRRGQPLLEEDPPAHDGERSQHRYDDPRPEQDAERVGEATGPLRIGHRVAKAQSEQRVALLEHGLATVCPHQQTERTQLLVDQVVDVVGAHRPAGRLRHRSGDVGGTLVPGALPEDRVEQRGELDRLPVRASGQRWRYPVAGSRHLPDQLDPVGAPRTGVDRSRLVRGHRHVSSPGGVAARRSAVRRPNRSSCCSSRLRPCCPPCCPPYCRSHPPCCPWCRWSLRHPG